MAFAGSTAEGSFEQWRKYQATNALGDLRAAESVLVLVRNIEQPELMGVHSSPTPFDGFPAARALVKIGEPAIRNILSRRTASPMSERQLKLFAYVVWRHYCLEDEREVGLFRMGRLLKKEEARREEEASRREGDSPQTTKEENLRRLIKVYQDIKPENPKDWPK